MLAEKIASVKADGALWVRESTIGLYLASSPMFKWLDKYFPVEEDEGTIEGTTVNLDRPADQYTLIA